MLSDEDKLEILDFWIEDFSRVGKNEVSQNFGSADSLELKKIKDTAKAYRTNSGPHAVTLHDLVKYRDAISSKIQIKNKQHLDQKAHGLARWAIFFSIIIPLIIAGISFGISSQQETGIRKYVDQKIEEYLQPAYAKLEILSFGTYQTQMDRVLLLAQDLADKEMARAQYEKEGKIRWATEWLCIRNMGEKDSGVVNISVENDFLNRESVHFQNIKGSSFECATIMLKHPMCSPYYEGELGYHPNDCDLNVLKIGKFDLNLSIECYLCKEKYQTMLVPACIWVKDSSICS